jgi:DNA-binding MarR family transcriptional regulator
MNSGQTLAQTIDDMNVFMCTCANLRRASRVVTRFYHHALKPTGLTPGQFTVLAALSRRGPKPQGELAEMLAMDRTTLIRNLRPLRGKQLVEATTTSRRGVKTLSLTKAGCAVLEQALPHWEKAQSHIVSALGPDRWGGLIEGLSSAVQAVQDR